MFLKRGGHLASFDITPDMSVWDVSLRFIEALGQSKSDNENKAIEAAILTLIDGRQLDGNLELAQTLGQEIKRIPNAAGVVASLLTEITLKSAQVYIDADKAMPPEIFSKFICVTFDAIEAAVKTGARSEPGKALSQLREITQLFHANLLPGHSARIDKILENACGGAYISEPEIPFRNEEELINCAFNTLHSVRSYRGKNSDVSHKGSAFRFVENAHPSDWGSPHIHVFSRPYDQRLCLGVDRTIKPVEEWLNELFDAEPPRCPEDCTATDIVDMVFKALDTKLSYSEAELFKTVSNLLLRRDLGDFPKRIQAYARNTIPKFEACEA